MIKDFKEFIMRGNVVDLAVAVVIGAAFGAVVTSLVNDVLMPVIAGVFGKPDFNNIGFSIQDSYIKIGSFLTAIVNFLLIAAAIFFFVVKPLSILAARRRKAEADDPSTRECPHCITQISVEASRCPNCTSSVTPIVHPE